MIKPTNKRVIIEKMIADNMLTKEQISALKWALTTIDCPTQLYIVVAPQDYSWASIEVCMTKKEAEDHIANEKQLGNCEYARIQEVSI